jgi:hypothetical protein
MKTDQIPGLFTVGILSAYLAYTIIDTLLREFSKAVTFIDLGAIFVLGLIRRGDDWSGFCIQPKTTGC